MDKARILIIDDDPSMRKTLSDILMIKGYDIVAAASGEEGLALLNGNAVNVALVDLGLPDISGLELLEKIKAGHPAVEAIVLTGDATLDSAVTATQKGAFSYLLKPYDIDQLLLQVRRAMEKQEAEVQIHRRNEELQSSNTELKTLQDISQAISRTLDMDELLSGVLSVMAGSGIFPFEIKGGIFLVEQGRVRLASYISVSESVLKPCQEVFSGKCLCGHAVVNGEIVVSKNSHEDPRHFNCHPDTDPHGHVVVPLKAVQEVVGLLSLYTQPGIEVNEGMLRLLSAIGTQVGIAINNARLYEQTKSSSLHDPLTGLANRRFLQMQMEKSFDAAKRYGEKLSIIMLDIDHFKKYNDTRGHLEGDKLLAKVAEVLVKELRNADYVFRYGGEEFLCMLPETDLPMAADVAERLRHAVETETDVPISLGVSSFHEEVADKESLIKMADGALYRAKQNGRNRVEVAEG
ncbi:MAG: diguanylate cyclase [Geobacter sp.]|nr:diguanylate cyclase [Geobacter sp.]